MATISNEAAHKFLDADLVRIEGLDFSEVRAMPEGTAVEAATKFHSIEGVIKDRECAAQLGLTNDFPGVIEMHKQLFSLAREDPLLKEKIMKRLFGVSGKIFTTFQPTEIDTDMAVAVVKASIEDMSKDEALRGRIRQLGEEYKGKDQTLLMQAVAEPFANSAIATIERVTDGKLTGPQGYVSYVMKMIELKADPSQGELLAEVEKCQMDLCALMQVA